MSRDFYRTVDRRDIYAVEEDTEKHAFYTLVRDFIARRALEGRRCLEIGSGKGLFQDLVNDYTGMDVAEDLAAYYHKNYLVAAGEALPFRNSSFDVVIACAVHEHVPALEDALEEILRILKGGGVCLFAPAWHTRPWFAEGLQVRPFGELDSWGKMIKLSIPVRDFFLFRWPFVFSRRLFRLLSYTVRGGRPFPLKYRRLKANYEKFWQSDSDACNSIDPFDVILWLRSRGVSCRGQETFGKAFFVRSMGLELEIPHREAAGG